MLIFLLIYVQKVIYERTTQNYSSEPHKIIVFITFFVKKSSIIYSFFGNF